MFAHCVQVTTFFFSLVTFIIFEEHCHNLKGFCDFVHVGGDPQTSVQMKVRQKSCLIQVNVNDFLFTCIA